MTLEIITDEKTGAEIAYIVNEDGTTVSMPKAVYEAQQVEHLTEISTGAN